MADLKRGMGFLLRIEKQYRALSEGVFRDAYVISSMAYALGYSTPIPVLASAADVPTSTLVDELLRDSPLRDVLQADRYGRTVKPRHRKIASLLIDEVVKPGDLYRLSFALARDLAPYVTMD